MATDLTVVLENRPGTLAHLGETLGKAGVNIGGACGVPSEGNGVIHIVVEDASASRKALESAGIKVSAERPVLLAAITDRPGELGKLARRIADAGVNVDLFYLTAKGQLVLGVDNLEKARKVVS
jgi:hypothetical protein